MFICRNNNDDLKNVICRLLLKFGFFDGVCYGEGNATTDHSPEGTQYIPKAGESECPAHSLPTP
jgi:hypothetical protein